MSSRGPWWRLLAGVLIVASLPVDATSFRERDYAYSATLRITGPGPAYAASLPLEVYRGATHPDLTDICVVNATGEVVPFAIRRPKAPRSPDPAPVSLRLFPVHGTSEGTRQALLLRLREGDTALDIERPSDRAAADHASSYLVDARALQRPIGELRIGWEAATPDFSARLQLDASDDLEHWHRLRSDAQIVSLHYAGQAFVRNEVAIPPTRTAFLRLTWGDGPVSAVITTVDAIPTATEEPLPRLSFDVAGSETEREFDFDLGARIPVEHVNLSLPERNSVVRAEFLIPVSGTRNWRAVAEGQFYDLVVPASGSLVNEPISVSLIPEQRWKVRVSAAGGGIGHGVPRLEVSWIPSEVLFLARGTGPFKLLFGSAGAGSLALTPDAILNPAGRDDTTAGHLQPGHASLEPAQVLGDPTTLKSAVPAADWKRWTLWTVLVLGVGVLASMAWKLSKSIG